MIHAYLFDLSLGGILMVLLMYGLGALVVFALVILLEAVVLWLMEWDTFLRSLLDSFLANLATTLLGVFFTPMTSSSGTIDESSFILKFLLLWGLSVLLEGGLIHIIRRKSLVRTFGASCIMNIGSYILLFILYQVLLK